MCLRINIIQSEHSLMYELLHLPAVKFLLYLAGKYVLIGSDTARGVRILSLARCNPEQICKTYMATLYTYSFKDCEPMITDTSQCK